MLWVGSVDSDEILGGQQGKVRHSTESNLVSLCRRSMEVIFTQPVATGYAEGRVFDSQFSFWIDYYQALGEGAVVV